VRIVAVVRLIVGERLESELGKLAAAGFRSTIAASPESAGGRLGSEADQAAVE